MMVVNTATLAANPNLGKALVGAWYETLSVMSGKDARRKAAIEHMAQAAGTDFAGFESMLATTHMYWTAPAALELIESPALVTSMDRVRQFSFSHGLLGAGAKTVDAVGIAFPGNKTLGNAKSIKMRFDSTYTKMAAEGKL